MPIDDAKSLQELEGNAWGEPALGSHLVIRCHELRRQPLRDLNVEDLRLMITQEIGLRYLVPIALTRLARDPFASGDIGFGDLLLSVIQVRGEFWEMHPDFRSELDIVVTDVAETIDRLLPAIRARFPRS